MSFMQHAYSACISYSGPASRVGERRLPTASMVKKGYVVGNVRGLGYLADVFANLRHGSVNDLISKSLGGEQEPVCPSLVSENACLLL